MNDIIADDIGNINADTYLMTHTTNPLLSPTTIKEAIKKFETVKNEGKDSLFSVNKYQTRFYRQDGSPVNHDPFNLIRTQDLEAWYEENSNIYIFSRASFSESKARIGVHPYLFETPKMESADIDDIVGWTMAEITALSRQIFEVHSESRKNGN